MNTLIAYAGKSGTTEEVVQRLGKSIGGEVDLADLKKNRSPDPSPYDNVLIGGAVYAGSINKAIRRFCEEHVENLEGKKVGLFLCSLREEEVEQNFEKNFPEKLRKSAAAKSWLGGRFIFSEHNFVIRGMMKKIMESEEDADNIQWDEVNRLAEVFAHTPKKV